MITNVECWKSPNTNGIQLVFYHDSDVADVYEFNDKDDVEYIMNLIRIQIPSDALLVEARDRTQTTVH